MGSAMPGWLTTALRAQSTQGDSDLAKSAGQISASYRQSVNSSRVITSSADALAYALSRMPATYAAVDAVLAELQAIAPDFVPRTLLDAGAGPGTATWAATDSWPELENAVLLDRNPHLLNLARKLAEGADFSGRATIIKGDLAAPPEDEGGFDLVLAAYSLTELADSMVAHSALGLWKRAAGALVIIEPGRPRDSARLLTVRDALIGQGATIVAPCPHHAACPLVEPDWCHFAVRLSRSRDHMRMKGGTLGYEDEKFSYLIATRPQVAVMPRATRVIKPPRETKVAVDLELCTPDGIEQRTVPSRDRAAYKAAKRLRWGDPAP